MKKLFKLTSLLLVFVMLFSFAACAPAKDPADTTQQGTTPGDTTADANKYADIAGEYLLDASDLGMPMKWYIKITADGKFNISTKRDFSDNKGEGTVGDKDGTYMLVYSDNTAENPKTATFKFEGKNMVFSTKVPIGKASVSPSDDGTKFPTAVLIANEELLGSYFGTLEVPMGGSGKTVSYSFQLDLDYGSKYTFASSFAMGGMAMTRTEKGTFDVNGTEISFTALDVDGEAVETPAAVKGTIENKTIKAAFTLSTMASAPQEIEAKFGTYTEWAGTYMANYQKTMMGQMAMTLTRVCQLELDAFGGYVYATVDPADPTTLDYSETGTYTVADGKFTFTSSAEGATAVEGTLENYILAAKFPISAMMSSPVDLSFYAEEVNGTFTASGEYEEKAYNAALSLGGGKFTLIVGDASEEAEEPNYIAYGSFTVEGGMVTQIALTTEALFETMAMDTPLEEIPAELQSFKLPVAESGISGELIFDLDDTAVIAFEFKK